VPTGTKRGQSFSLTVSPGLVLIVGPAAYPDGFGCSFDTGDVVRDPARRTQRHGHRSRPEPHRGGLHFHAGLPAQPPRRLRVSPRKPRRPHLCLVPRGPARHPVPIRPGDARHGRVRLFPFRILSVENPPMVYYLARRGPRRPTGSGAEKEGRCFFFPEKQRLGRKNPPVAGRCAAPRENRGVEVCIDERAHP